MRSAAGEGRLRAVPASQIQPEPIDWLWAGRVPLGMVTLLIGDPGLGKSLLTCDLAARISQEGHGTLMLTAEDSASATVRPRLEAADADLDLVRVVEAASPELEGPTIPGDLDELGRLATAATARLVVIDPLVAHLPERVNTWSDQSVRRALRPLHRLAQDLRCAMLVVVHLNKRSEGNALQRTGGSIGITAAARSALLLGGDPTDPNGASGDRRVLVHTKCNVASKAPSLLYRTETLEVGGVSTGRLRCLGTSEISEEDLLARPAESGNSRMAEATAFLEDELSAGPQPARKVTEAAREAGVSGSTLKRARRALGVTSRRVEFGSEGHWEWSLPIEAQDQMGLNVDRELEPLCASPVRDGDCSSLDPTATTIEGQPEPVRPNGPRRLAHGLADAFPLATDDEQAEIDRILNKFGPCL